MKEILLRAALLLLIILLGQLLRRIRFLPDDTFRALSRIVLNVTLPCAVITNFSGVEVSGGLLWMFPIGFLCNVLYLGIGYLSARKQPLNEQVYRMLNYSGYNIGCFALPYVSTLFGPTVSVSLCFFDAGSAILATGGTNAICESMQDGGKLRIGKIFKRMATAPTILVYLLMTLFAILHITLPSFILQFAEIGGSANTFLAMFMLGVGMRLDIKLEQLRSIIRAFVIRFGIAIALSLACLFLLPFEREICLGAALVVLAPVSSASAAFSEERGLDVGLAASWNTLSILFSLVFMTVLMMLTA